MNTREQILAKRVAALEARLQASMVVIDHLIKDLEFTESVGAAFAFDLVTTLKHLWIGNEVNVTQIECWDRAVKALEQAQFAAGRRRGKTEMTMGLQEATQEESGK